MNEQIKAGKGAFTAAFAAVLLGLLLFVAGAAGVAAAERPARQAGDVIWSDVAEASIAVQGQRLIIPQQYRTVAVTPESLQARLVQAPLADSPAARSTAAILSLPLPDGTVARFRVLESPVMAPELAARFPQMKTYVAQGLDDPSLGGRLDWTPAGFHALIFTPEGTFYIDPYSQGDVAHYIVYFKRDYLAPAAGLSEEAGPFRHDSPGALPAGGRPSGGFSTGSQLRTYRLAVAATGEYTQYHGGSVADGLAAIVTAVNRVTGIYEREVAVRLVLVANNDDVVYTNPGTDPYTNNNGLVLLGQNQSNLDAVIGNSNYDVGHVFSTGGGGVAYLEVPCVSGWKARGVTGLSAPTGDPFYVDYVAHEMGHQFGANHTFNGNAGSCSAQRHGPTAYEPGSGSTIMAYAGICGDQDLQSNSDDYFHTISFDEIVAYTTLGNGNSCAAITATGNAAPVMEAGSGGYTIPRQTPFTLTGSGSDPNGDPITYDWEQFDLGPAGHPNFPLGNAPIFRSFSAASGPSRTFPRLSDIVNNSQTIGEILPATDRTLTFRLTGRDNQLLPGAGGVAYDTVALAVTDAAGPFLVTAPNAAVTWDSGAQKSVTWDVANTDIAPVNCSAVKIRLSTDGGYTYPLTLLNNTANDGSAVVTVPNEATAEARVRVQCASNIFFDISNVDFTIVGQEPPEVLVYLPIVPKEE